MDTKLELDEKIEMLKYNISRFDHYYASVNFKSSFLVIGNITILGFILNNTSKINTYVFGGHIILLTVSLIFVLLAIRPYLKSYEGKNSLIFFNDVSNMENCIYKSKVNFLSKENYIKDLKEQNLILVDGLKRKFDYLNKSTIAFIINIVLFFVIEVIEKSTT
jgi:hypothetical protein